MLHIFFSLVFFLSGCISRIEQPSAVIEEAKPNTDQFAMQVRSVPSVTALSSTPFIALQQPSIIEYQDQTPSQSLENIRHYDWNGTIQSMVDNMLQKAENVSTSSILLVDSINNRTNGRLNAREATETLRKALRNKKKFTLVSTQELSIAKQKLGLSLQDSFGSRSKAIGIARNLGAQYVLYSNAIGNVNSPSLQMQLMLVQTGEIIWSNQTVVTQS